MSTTVQHVTETESYHDSDSKDTSHAYQSPSRPERAVSRTYPGMPQKPDSIELQRLSGPASAWPATPAPAPAAKTDLEMSRPTTPTSSDPPQGLVEAAPSAWDPYMNRYRLMAMLVAALRNGLTDAAAGALIPYMEKWVAHVFNIT